MSDMRLQKFLARAGVASRRAAEGLISEGRVSVNGAPVTELGSKVDPSHDTVEVDGSQVTLPDESITLMLHKPAGYVTTMADPQGRPTVAELVPLDEYLSLFPVGRLDNQTTGLLLFTTDGDLGNALIHPRHHVFKRYICEVEGTLTESDCQRLREGIVLDDGITLPAHVELLDANSSEVQVLKKQHFGHVKRKSKAGGTSFAAIEIQEGRNRQVRRMFAAVGHSVLKLHRVSLGPLVLGTLPEGTWRELSEEELSALRDS